VSCQKQNKSLNHEIYNCQCGKSTNYPAGQSYWLLVITSGSVIGLETIIKYTQNLVFWWIFSSLSSCRLTEAVDFEYWRREKAECFGTLNNFHFVHLSFQQTAQPWLRLPSVDKICLHVCALTLLFCYLLCSFVYPGVCQNRSTLVILSAMW
jgi:hypothetical protein